MRFPHCLAIFYNLPWFYSIKVSNKKSQRNVVNACGKWMCKLSLMERRPGLNLIKLLGAYLGA